MSITRKAITNLSLALALAAACAASVGAQGREEHVISARAGGVNFVSGEVTFRRAGHDAWLQLATTDELKAGDTVRAAADGRAEILLNPGSYLRLGASSEFELTDPALDSLRLKLLRGSVLVEAAGYRDSDVAITLDTPQSSVSIVRSGIYRVNVAATPGTTEVFVREGRALVGAARTLLKGGMSARVGASGVAEVAKFKKKEKDALDVWGKSRAEEVARTQRRLQARQVNAAFAQTRWWDTWNTTNGLFGVWYRAGGSCYTFLPFYFWVSPYGYVYDMELPAFAYLCGSCHRRARPWPSTGFGNSASGVTVERTPVDTMKPAKSVDLSPGSGMKFEPVKIGVTVPTVRDGGGSSPVVHGGSTKNTPPPRDQD